MLLKSQACTPFRICHPSLFGLVVIEFALLIVSSVSMQVVPFQTIEKGHSSGIEDAVTGVYRTREAFETFWARHGSNSMPPPDVPDVDFTARMVVAVFWGTRNSGGYSVEITSVNYSEDGNELVVNYLTTDPPPGAILTMALTQPYHIVSLDASEKNVVFEGSAAPTRDSNHVPVMLLTFEEGADIDKIVSEIEKLPAVSRVKKLSVRVAFVYFDSEKISKADAMQSLKDVEGVKTVEEDQ